MFGISRHHKSTEDYYSDEADDGKQDYVRQFGQGKLSNPLNQ